jgi:hypothetical protein
MKPETLFDILYKASFRNEPIRGWKNNALLREALLKSKRFVLTDEMSTMLGHLSIEAFLGAPLKNVERRRRQVETFRTGARLPHESIWIEYSLRHCQRVVRNALHYEDNVAAGPVVDVNVDEFLGEIPMREGWLIQRHPHIENAIIAHIVTHSPDAPDPTTGSVTWTFPVAYAWTTDNDTVLPWRPLELGVKQWPFDDVGHYSVLAFGIDGYVTDRVSIVNSPMLNYLDNCHTESSRETVAMLVGEWTGCVRRMTAFLSTINDLPIVMGSVRPDKGFFAKGKIRKYLAHQTIHLTVPAKRFSTVAKKAVAMAHRRAHDVRGHWRDDWRHPYQPLCDHAFEADADHRWCTVCNGRETWIRPHQRGDAALGFVTHDYAVNAGAPSP